ncbi:MAG: hypothetical protein ACFCU4_00960 [Puniceicoccaceae bacterium]
MNPGTIENRTSQPRAETCGSDGCSRGCNKGLCPGTLVLAVVVLIYGLSAVGNWVWSLLST